MKRTLYFQSQVILKCRQRQLLIQSTDQTHTLPIEDIGTVILDSPQAQFTGAVLPALLAENVAVITCNEKHLPTGLLLNLDGHSYQSGIFQSQLQAKTPQKKQLWQQTIKAKIRNQRNLLQKFGLDAQGLTELFRQVRSGDAGNTEALAAAYYWKMLGIHRERMGQSPNNRLNYVYAVLRATVARSLVGSGLLPVLGIYHHHQRNAHCLADDIMEPYRPYADDIVFQTLQEEPDISEELTPTIKQKILKINQIDCHLHGERFPLEVAVRRTTSSLANCFQEGKGEILYPIFPVR